MPTFRKLRKDFTPSERVATGKALEARATEVYAAQVLNLEAERKAAEIRIRAERRCGQPPKARRRHPANDMPDLVTTPRARMKPKHFPSK